MKITRNTKLYRASDGKAVEIVYRTLTITELKTIESIKNQFYKAEFAYELGYISGNEPNFLAKYQIGLDIIEASTFELNNETLFSLTIDDFRSSVKEDLAFNLISHVVNVFPGTSLEYLLNITYTDLMEIAAFCEKITNKKIFNMNSSSVLSEKKQNGKVFFEDDGKTLQEKMKEISDF